MSYSPGDSTPPAPETTPRGLLSHWRMMKRVLVATDGSLSAADAIGFAVDFASARAAELIFVHVVPTVEFLATTGYDDVHGAVPHEPTGHDHALLQDAAALAAEHGVPATTVLLGGSTAAEIVAHAESCGADLIVIGSRGQGPVASALLGSVALGVLHASKQPVLVVRCAMPPHSPGAPSDAAEATV
jgi:nucleotide-binding universal stress UspA family protein